MATSFRPTIARNYNSACVDHYTPDGSATFTANELVYFDTSTQTMKVCGADPSLIAGLAVGGGSSTTTGAQLFSEQAKISVYRLQSDTVVSMSSSTTPAVTHIGVLYGIAATSGVWQVDTSDTSNTRVIVVDVDITNGIFYVNFIAANLQFDGVAS